MVKVYPTIVKSYSTLVPFGMPLRQKRAPQRIALLTRLWSYDLRTCSIRYALQRIHGLLPPPPHPPSYYHTTREQGALTGRAKHHAYMRLGYLA
jgi:hypothetical protein